MKEWFLKMNLVNNFFQMSWLATLLLVLIVGVASAQQPYNQPLTLADLEGKWYINQTNFPMWLKANRTLPTFNYTYFSKNGQAFLLDEVRFLKNGKPQSINGIDKPVNANNTAFVWRGKGLLRLLKSRWSILHFNPTQQWAIIFFEKTLFTPAGYDVISRKPQLSTEMNNQIAQQLQTLGITEKLIALVH